MWGMVRRGPRRLARILALAVVLTAAVAPVASADGSSKSGDKPSKVAGSQPPGDSSGAGAPGPDAASAGWAAPGDPAECSQQPPGQTFLGDGDFNYYSPAPGPLENGFDGSTWSLSGGATVVSTQLADGSTGNLLDLPAGSQAVSPDMCIDPSTNPMIRAMVQSLNGGDNVQVSISYYTSSGWSNPQGAGNLQGQNTSWTASNPQHVPNPPGPGNQPGWQVVRLILTPQGGQSEFDVYGLAVSVLPPIPSTGPCSDAVLSQPFLGAGDANYYTQAPDFSTWTMTGGAQVETTTLADGSTGSVLDLPAGSMAVSPDICVTSLYPTARMMIRSLFGGDDLSFRVSYGNTNTWTNPHETGHVNGQASNWTLSDSVQLQPGNGAGWQIVRLTLVPDGGHSEFQIYNLELDPYAKG